MKFPARLAVATFAVAAVALAGIERASDDVPILAALRVFLAAIVVGFAPGALVWMALKSGSVVTELEVFGFGAVTSFLLVQGACIAAISGHWPITWSLGATTLVAIAAAIVVCWRGGVIAVAVPRLALLAGLVVLGILLYFQGAPYSSSEDQIHLALARRLEFWATPDRSHVYFLNGVQEGFYPYPFPAIHYFIASIARVADLDVMFVYHKLRAFWAPVTITLLYLGAVTTFGEGVGLVTTVTALLFVVNGTFANSFNFFWGQLTPFSHASDVALGVLLPALIVLTCRFAMADTNRDRWCYGGAALALTFSLCIVHVREVVQQLVYISAWLAASMVSLRDRHRAKWILALLVSTVMVAVLYRYWYSVEMGFVNTVVDSQRQSLVARLRSMGWLDLVIGKPPMDAQGGQLMFVGWNAVMLLLTPILLITFPGRPVVRFIGITILVYMLILRFPIFTIPYTLASYFEITTSGVRNVMFFIHLCTGVILWSIAGAIGRLRQPWPIAAWPATVVLLGLGWQFGLRWFFFHQDTFFLPLIAAWAAVLWWEWRFQPAGGEPIVNRRQLAIWAAMIVVLVVWTFVPGDVLASNAAVSGSPLTVPYRETAQTPRIMFDQLGGCVDWKSQPLPFQPAGVTPVESGPFRTCPPSKAFLAFARQNIPVDAVVAASKVNLYPMAVYLPVRIVAWPSLELTYHDETRALGAYYALWDRALRTHRAQPFFNASESRAEREEFLSKLGVTHVVVDPNLHALLKPILDEYTDVLTRQYDDGEWSVYQVARRP